MLYAMMLWGLMGLMVLVSYHVGRGLRGVSSDARYGGYYVSLLIVLLGLPVVVLVLLLRWKISLILLMWWDEDVWVMTGVRDDLLSSWLYARVIAESKVGMLPGGEEGLLRGLEVRLVWFYGCVGWVGMMMLVMVSVCGVWRGIVRLRGRLNVVNDVEGLVLIVLKLGSVVAIATSFMIVLSLIFESWKFFREVPLGDFFFGVNWEPQLLFGEESGEGKDVFGILPVLWGTLAIAMIAMWIAIPVGLLSAIYLNTYASVRIRSIVKPVLELLAGIPTIVYGFVAVLVVAPFFHRVGLKLGFASEPNNALAAGVVMGMMIVPFVSSFADDALNDVPLSVKYGSYALGATRAETVVRVMLPAAFPGIASGILLAVSRAIGETMIVVMAAGLVAKFSWSPFEGMTTITVQIMALLVGDTSFDSPKTLSAFALGLTLFLITLQLNVIAFWLMKRYRVTST